MKYLLTCNDLSKIEENIHNGLFTVLNDIETSNEILCYYRQVNPELTKLSKLNTSYDVNRIKAVETTIKTVITDTVKLSVTVRCLILDNSNLIVTYQDYYMNNDLIQIDNTLYTMEGALND